VKIVGTFEDGRATSGGSVGLVPTMGALHEGHLSHVEAARRDNDVVVVSVFVNPLQFDQQADLEAYPHDLERDAELAEKAGADLLFAPTEQEMYPEPPLTAVSVPVVSEGMEGAHRAGHFEGVSIVVTKLLAGIRPDRAYFGRKDAQQLALVRRLAADLSFPVEVVGGPIVRERDGLALSSRNTRLSAAEHRSALALVAGLEAVAEAVERGEGSGAALEALAGAPIVAEQGVTLEYATLAAQRDAIPLRGLDAPAFLAVAARVGRTRLIDNVHIDSAGDRWVPDLGRRLDGPSILYGEA
jgi:pantoate--beta-alanine ligase